MFIYKNICKYYVFIPIVCEIYFVCCIKKCYTNKKIIYLWGDGNQFDWIIDDISLCEVCCVSDDKWFIFRESELQQLEQHKATVCVNQWTLVTLNSFI